MAMIKIIMKYDTEIAPTTVTGTGFGSTFCALGGAAGLTISLPSSRAGGQIFQGFFGSICSTVLTWSGF